MNTHDRPYVGAARAGEKDKSLLRALAGRVMEIASSPKMDERRRAWRASHDLKSYRPVLVFETFAVEGFKDEAALQCEDPYLRDVEKHFREMIRHYEEIDDDFVVDPCFRVPWKFRSSGYGIDMGLQRGVDAENRDIAYSYDYFVKKPEDIDRLSHNTHTVFREDTEALAEKVADAVGDILPVHIGGLDIVFTEYDGMSALCKEAEWPGGPGGGKRYVGYTPFWGDYCLAICMAVYKLLGNDNLSFWPYDYPDDLKRLFRFIRDDRIMFYEWAEKEGLLTSNANGAMIGSGPMGCVSDLATDSLEPTTLSRLWGWCEAQEAEIYSPEMFAEFCLPYLKEAGDRFGLITYGCCEKLTDRLELALAAMQNIRTVSVSPYNDDRVIADIVGNRYGYCRKVHPTPLSVKQADYDWMRRELAEIASATRDCHLQVAVRDVYDVHGDFARMGKWASLVREALGM